MMGKRKTATKIAGLVLVALWGVACDRENPTPEPERNPRTLIVYIAADEATISYEASEKVEAMRRGWSSGNGELLIYYDSRNTPSNLLRLQGGRAGAEPYVEAVGEYGDENSADPEILRRVVQQVVRDYPADSYGLLVFAHASGWLPAGTLENPEGRSLIIDDAIGSGERHEMELSQFAAALPNRGLDFIIFEMCLMSGVEVMYELRNKAEYILASSAELLSPGFTPVYEEGILGLFDTGSSVSAVLEGFGRKYISYVNTLSGYERSATLSLIRTAGVEPLAALAKEAYATMEQKPDPASVQHFDRPGIYRLPSPRFFDLGDCLRAVSSAGLWPRIAAQMEETVIWKAATESFMMESGYHMNGFGITAHSGLTTYIEQSAYPRLDEAYRSTGWYRATH